jgi:hypothetical protein
MSLSFHIFSSDTGTAAEIKRRVVKHLKRAEKTDFLPDFFSSSGGLCG